MKNEKKFQHLPCYAYNFYIFLYCWKVEEEAEVEVPAGLMLTAPGSLQTAARFHASKFELKLIHLGGDIKSKQTMKQLF